MFLSEKLDGKQILRYTLKDDENIDRISLGMLSHSSVNGFAQISYISDEQERRFTFFPEDNVPIKDFLFESLNIGEISQIAVSMSDIFIDACSHLIPAESVCSNPDYIYINPQNKHITMICVPVYPGINSDRSDDILKQILRFIIPDSDYTQRYLDALVKYVENNGAFSWKEFKNLALTYLPAENGNSDTDNNQEQRIKPKEIFVNSGKTSSEISTATENTTSVDDNRDKNINESNFTDTDIDYSEAFSTDISLWELLTNFSTENLKAYKRCRKRKNGSLDSDKDNVIAKHSQDKKLPAGDAYLTRRKTGGIIPITGSVFRIGKDSGQTDYTVYGNPTISRNHARIFKKDGLFYLSDNHSTNKTYIDNAEVKPESEALLRNGAVIRLSNEDFVFTLSAPTV